MMRSPSLPAGYDDSSSLDPLAESPDVRTSSAASGAASPSKRRLSSPTKSATRKRSSTNHQRNQTPELVSFLVNSPSRTVTEQTLSPWRIRVTVEAEPQEGQAGTMTTRTVKIPLRQSSSPTPVESSRERGRNSTPGAAKPKRSGTPVRGKHGSRSRSRRQSVTDLDIVVLGDDGDSDEWTGKKKSPRKKRAPGRGRGRSASVDPEVASTGKRQTNAPEFDIYIDADEEVAIRNDTEQPELASPELRQIDLNRVSVRPRAQSTKQKEDSERPAEGEPCGKKSSQNPPQISTRKVSVNSVLSYPTPSPTSSYHDDSDEVQKAQDPTTQHEGFDTIIESEGFTMIDLDSVPSARHFLSTPSDSQGRCGNDTPQATENPAQAQALEQIHPPSHVKPSPIPTYMVTVDEESELSSTVPSPVPSSPPVIESSLLSVPQPRLNGLRKVTPLAYSSPKLPSPPRQIRKGPRGHERSLSREAVTAGMALQDIILPEKGHSKTPCIASSQRTPRSLETVWYDGYSSGTKRELRAGLRFGEELAKRQKSRPLNTHFDQHAPSIAPGPIVKPIVPDASTQVWRGEALVRYSPFPSNEQYQAKKDASSSPHVDTSFSAMQNPRTKDLCSATSRTETPKSSTQTLDSGWLDTDARRQHEWQLEREAVSRQINNVSPSKVIVIDSDDDVEEDAPCALAMEREERQGGSETQEQTLEGKTERVSPRRNESESREIGQAAGCAGGEAERIERAAREATQDVGVPMEEDACDIWLEEAKANSSSPREEAKDLFTRSEQQRQRERAASLINKPKRSLLPSPWKRGEDINASTFMSNGEASGLFWQQAQNSKFGDADIAQQKRELRNGGSFDLERMLSSPVKLAQVGRRSSMELRIEKINRDLIESDQDEATCEDEEGSDLEEEPPSLEEGALQDASQSTEESLPNSPPVTKVPVKFNDSTLSHQNTPPRPTRSSRESSEERPPTPRSALKGARQSIGAPPPQISPRKVVFSQRSMCLNEDGEESSMSAMLDSPQVEQPEPAYQEEEVEQATKPEQKKGWLGWLLKGHPAAASSPNNTTLASQANTTPQLDGSHDSPQPGPQSQPPSPLPQWQPTRTALPSTLTSQPLANRHPKPKSPSIPSYLKPPSYPSDPSRSPTTLLASSGDFTNTHFRTLHIIHAKSLRPRFHPPRSIRPGIQALLGWKLEVDAVERDSEVFEWKVGQGEVEVLERFMQEVEWSCVLHLPAEERIRGMRDVRWGWAPEELARCLGMVVIGEVVRSEEEGR